MKYDAIVNQYKYLGTFVGTNLKQDIVNFIEEYQQKIRKKYKRWLIEERMDI
jgi:hypothetical protein